MNVWNPLPGQTVQGEDVNQADGWFSSGGFSAPYWSEVITNQTLRATEKGSQAFLLLHTSHWKTGDQF